MQNTDNSMQKSTQPMEEWEERFIEKFGSFENNYHLGTPEEIKAFITQEKSLSYAQGRADMAREMREAVEEIRQVHNQQARSGVA